MRYEFKEEDWQQFRKMIPVWQERFMSELIVEYTRLLMNDGRESDKFWMLKKRIDDDVNKVGVQIEMKRGTMVSNLIRLLKEGAVTLNDLDGFSDELTETIRSSINRY